MKTILIALTFLLGLNAFAQKDKKIKDDTKFIYKNTVVETDDYKIYITDAVATKAYAKFKFKIFNKTNDFLIIKIADLFYLAEGKNLVCSEKKDIIVAPNDEASKVIDFKGEGYRIDNFIFDVKAIHKASAGGKVLSVANFVIPASTNQFEVGGLSCIMLDSKVKTDRSSTKFECTYNGDAIAILDPYKCAAIMDNGKENANQKKYAPVLLDKGKKEDFFVIFDEISGAGDMQKKGFTIKWNDTFKETKLISMKGVQIKMEKESEKD